jgi:hypothetical protein
MDKITTSVGNLTYLKEDRHWCGRFKYNQEWLFCVIVEEESEEIRSIMESCSDDDGLLNHDEFILKAPPFEIDSSHIKSFEAVVGNLDLFLKNLQNDILHQYAYFRDMHYDEGGSFVFDIPENDDEWDIRIHEIIFNGKELDTIHISQLECGEYYNLRFEKGKLVRMDHTEEDYLFENENLSSPLDDLE